MNRKIFLSKTTEHVQRVLGSFVPVFIHLATEVNTMWIHTHWKKALWISGIIIFLIFLYSISHTAGGKIATSTLAFVPLILAGIVFFVSLALKQNTGKIFIIVNAQYISSIFGLFKKGER
jgi:hypothetical protein